MDCTKFDLCHLRKFAMSGLVIKQANKMKLIFNNQFIGVIMNLICSVDILVHKNLVPDRIQ